ncbi:MAG: hypothetical protein MUC88_22985 [Planctomycetes bacterium]|jgi:hypothetical protein|nr:hypothetical protein [Planctomycetota bacterium]
MDPTCCIDETPTGGYELLPKSAVRHPRPRTSEIRVEKILAIRGQLGEGTYSIGDRLDVVVERIIEDLREV